MECTRWTTSVSFSLFVVIICTNSSADDSGRQTKHLLWWPKASVQDMSSLNAVYWTPYCEQWFVKCLSMYHAGEGQPKTSGEWQDLLRQAPAHARRFRKVFEAASTLFTGSL